MQIGISHLIYLLIPVSIIAYLLVIKKNILGLHIYTSINIALIVHNYYINDYMQMALMITYTILSIYGIYKWRGYE